MLPEIDEKLADYAVSELRGRGIEIRLRTTLDSLDAERARLSTGESVPTRTVVWTAGVKPHPSLANLSVPLDDRGRVTVDEHLRVKEMQGVWAVGDCAAVPDPRGGFAPPTAQHGIRQARLAANNVAGALGGEAPARCTYSRRTAFVNLGRYKAVGRIGGSTFSSPACFARSARSSTGP